MFTKILIVAAATAMTAGAAALPSFPRAVTTAAANGTANSTAGFQQVVYWGQNDAERDLGAYCNATEGIDVLVLSFLSSYGSGNGPSGSFGACSTDKTCTKLESDVAICKAAGKKIFVSIGGEGASGTVSSQSDGQTLGQDIWDSYANPAAASNKNAVRPLGSQFVDGFDLDIESGGKGNGNYQYLISTLRGNFAKDSANTYYISGAPQCPIPEPNMGEMIAAAKFDLLFVQFYNNDPCSANSFVDGNQNDFNFDAWHSYIAKGASAGAKLFIGLPASKEGATGDDSGAKYYLQPSDMKNLVNEYKTHPGFGGVMLWDAGNSDLVNENGCHYSGEVRSVLDKGQTC